MSGHSKWSQIKHKKAITDAKRGKIFSKLVRDITIASKIGGNNPDTNIRLRAAIDRARNMGVLKDNIERAINKGWGNTHNIEFKEFLYEATGPGGIAILIEGMSGNTNRSINEIKHLLNLHDGRIVNPGSLLWNFQKIGVLEVNKKEKFPVFNNDAELAFIETGAFDFFSTDNMWVVETTFIDRERVRKYLEQKGVLVMTSGHDFKPINTITLDPQTAVAAESLLDALIEHEDVQEVYTNIRE